LIPRPLIQGWIGALVFLELCDDSAVDPDVAVKLMESMVGLALQLPTPELNELRSVIQELASSEPHADNQRVMREIADALDETDEDD
jgi:hypothetical protein